MRPEFIALRNRGVPDCPTCPNDLCASPCSDWFSPRGAPSPDILPQHDLDHQAEVQKRIRWQLTEAGKEILKLEADIAALKRQLALSHLVP